MYPRCTLLLCCLAVLTAADPSTPSGSAPSAIPDNALVTISDDAAWQAIQQHPLDPSKSPAADDPRWIPLGTYRSRDYQLTNPREPGLGLWIQTRVEVKNLPSAGDTVVLALANALIADAGFLNGTELANETFSSNRPFPSDDQVLYPANQNPTAAFFAQWDNPKNSFWTREALLGRDFGAIRRPMSALFSAPASKLKAGRNTLQLAIFEQEVNTMLPGPVELRRARLDDRVQLNSFTRAAGDNAAETILLVQQALPGSDPVRLTIEMQSDVGRVLWTETPALDFNQGKFQQAIPIKPRSFQDYKAVVRATAPGQPVVEHWAYTHQAHIQPSTLRDEFNLTTTNWEYRPIAQDEEVVIPAPANGWKKGKPGNGAADGYKHRYYFRTTFTAPAELAKGRALLGIGELRMKGDFFFNGQSLGTRRYYEAPFELDISGAVKPGKPNELLVVLHDGMTPEFLTDGTPPVADGQKQPPALTSRFHSAYLDKVRLNHLSLRRVPDVRVLRNRIVTSVKDGTFTVTSTLENATSAPVTVTPEFTVEDRTGKVLSFTGQPVTVPAKGTTDSLAVQAWANAKLWSPESPYLYALETSLTTRQGIIDGHRERFGFREIEVVGKNFVLNGQIIRFRTLAPSVVIPKIANQQEPDFFKVNTNIASLRASKEIGFNALRIRDVTYVRTYYAACDEIGLATGILSDLVDNLSQRIAFTDPVTWENSYKELVSFHQTLGNHASALWYDLGNENLSFGGPNSHPKVADFIYQNEQRIRAYDPTRFVFSSGGEGGYDGRAQVHSPHYPWTASGFGSFAPTQWWYLTTRYSDIPKSLLDRTLWSDPDPANRYKGMAKFPGGAWANVPIFNDEYAWLQDWKSGGKLDGNGQSWAGERTFKPFGPRIPNTLRRQIAGGSAWNVFAIGNHLTFLERIEMETQAYRGQGLAGLTRWDLEYRLPEGPHMPIVAFLREHVRATFDDAPVTRTLYAVNDAVNPVKLDLQVRIHRLAPDGARSAVQTEKISQTLKPGEIVQRALTIPAQKVTAPTTFLAEVVRNDGGTDRFLHRQQWTVFPRAWLGSIPPNARVTVYDPQGSINGLFESLEVNPQRLDNPADIAKSDARLLVIGENADAQALTAATPQLATFLRGGGTLFALRQPAAGGINGWLPVILKNEIHWDLKRSYPGAMTSLTARHHPLFAGLLPADLGYWAPEGLVFGAGYSVVGSGFPNARILAGLVPFSAHVIEGTLGQGRWIATTLELTPETVRTTPAAARLMVNLINLAQMPPAAATAPAPAPAPQPVVYQPANGTPLAKALRNDLKVIATFTVTEPTLAPDQTLFLTDWKTDAPSANFAAQVRAWLTAGGTLVVQGGGPDLAPWLEKATGLKVTAQPAIDNSQGSKIAVHPLLDGVFEADLQWDQRPTTLDQPGTFANLLLRAEGATELLHPAALSVATIGQGRLVIDQTRWNEAKEAQRGLRFQRTLLTNLGLRVQALDYGASRERFTVPEKLAFSPLSLGEALTLEATRSGMDLSGFKPPFVIAGVPFAPLAEGKNLVALASGAAYADNIRQQLGQLPATSHPIAVGRAAKHLFFAHTGYFHQATEGDTVLTYIVRYAGHEKIIGGQDAGDLIQTISVRAGIDLADWFGHTGVGLPRNAAAATTKSGGTALVFVQRWDNPFPDRVIDSIVVQSVPAAKSQPYVLGVTAAGN